jgi:hypothetical protein
MELKADLHFRAQEEKTEEMSGLQCALFSINMRANAAFKANLSLPRTTHFTTTPPPPQIFSSPRHSLSVPQASSDYV